VQNYFDLKMRVCLYKLNNILRSKPPWHHSVSILHAFKDPFAQKESAREEHF